MYKPNMNKNGRMTPLLAVGTASATATLFSTQSMQVCMAFSLPASSFSSGMSSRSIQPGILSMITACTKIFISITSTKITLLMNTNNVYIIIKQNKIK